jgi:hypothetical protein
VVTVFVIQYNSNVSLGMSPSMFVKIYRLQMFVLGMSSVRCPTVPGGGGGEVQPGPGRHLQEHHRE